MKAAQELKVDNIRNNVGHSACMWSSTTVLHVCVLAVARLTLPPMYVYVDLTDQSKEPKLSRTRRGKGQSVASQGVCAHYIRVVWFRLSVCMASVW